MTTNMESPQNSFELSFSSETPYRRYDWWTEYYYDEVLSHKKSAVDLSRLREMGVILYNHHRDDVIGRVTSASIADNRGIAVMEFDADAQSQTIAEKVRAGTLKAISVAYTVEQWKVTPAAKRTDGVTDAELRTAIKWTPLEISIVSVPADTSVGVGREMEDDNMDTQNMKAPERAEIERGETAAVEMRGTGAPITPVPAADAEREIKAERERAAGILSLYQRHGLTGAEEMIRSGASLGAAKDAVLDALAKRQAPIAPAAGDGVQRDEADKYIRAASDALLLRAGNRIAKPAEGALALRSMRLRDLFVDCELRTGNAQAHRLSPDEMLEKMATREYLSPTAIFPQILDQTINKSYAAGYQLVQPSFERWTALGSLPDFKSTPIGWRMGAAGELELLPEGAEINHDIPTDSQTGSRRLQTYARAFSMTREAFINDDIGYLASLPGRYAQSARYTINRQVYKILASNPKLADGKTLFHASRGNLAGTAGALNMTNLIAALRAFKLQKDDAGRLINVVPRYLVVPTGLGETAHALLTSPTLRTSVYTSASSELDLANPLTAYNLEVVEEPELVTLLPESEQYAWFLVADHATADSVQIDYLNGVQTLNLRRMETINRLGYVWDTWLDWGVNVIDWRGVYKNAGAAVSDL